MILKMADWIIPGHGTMYKNNKAGVLAEEEVEIGGPKGYPTKESRIVVVCKKCGRVAASDKNLCKPVAL